MRPELSSIEQEPHQSFVTRHGNEWFHVTTLEKAHQILHTGLIAPDSEIDPIERERTWSDEWLTSRDGYVYLASERVLGVDSVARMVDPKRKGTNRLIALRVDISSIEDERFSADEDHVANPEHARSAQTAWARFVNAGGGYRYAEDDYAVSTHDHEDLFVAFAEAHPDHAMLVDLHEQLRAAYDFDTEHASLGELVESLEDVDSAQLRELSASQGTIAVAGNIHPDDISVHPEYLQRYEQWLRANPQPEPAPPAQHLHTSKDQLALFEHGH